MNYEDIIIGRYEPDDVYDLVYSCTYPPLDEIKRRPSRHTFADELGDDYFDMGD